MALVPESAPENAVLRRDRGLRVFILVVILLGGFFAIVYFGQPHSPPVEASATGKKGEPPATPPAATNSLPYRGAGAIYLQLSATRRESAERMANDLRKQNFEAVTAEIDGKPGMFRVLVGPMNDTDVPQLRGDLERTGFAGNAAIRRTSAEFHPSKPGNAIPLSAPTKAEPGPAIPDAVQSLSPGTTGADTSNRPVAKPAYLEFSATSRQAAEIIADQLHVKGFDATASEAEDFPGVFRVLVRPANDASIDQLRADLESAGFHGSAAILRIAK